MLVKASEGIKGAAAIMANVIDQARKLLLADGVTESNANKIVGALTPSAGASLGLVFPTFHIVGVHTGSEKLFGHPVFPVKGFFDVRPQNRPAYRIELEDVEDQHSYLIAIQRMGKANIQSKTMSVFWSYAWAFPETKEANSQMLVIGLDNGNDGENVGLEFSARLYIENRRSVTGGQAQRINRLNTLQFPPNITGILTAIAMDANFPLEESRKNRDTAAERRDRRNNAGSPQAPTSLVESRGDQAATANGAGALPVGAGAYDPFNP